MAEPDIRVRVGVEGGASIDQGSGAHIRKELQKIAASISSQKKVKISVFLNDGVAKRLQQDLDTIAKNLTLNIGKVDASGATITGTPSNSGRSESNRSADANVNFKDFKDGTVSLRRMSQATALVTRARVQGIEAINAEKVALERNKKATADSINASKLAAQQSKERTAKLREESAALRLKSQQEKMSSSQRKDSYISGVKHDTSVLMNKAVGTGGSNYLRDAIAKQNELNTLLDELATKEGNLTVLDKKRVGTLVSGMRTAIAEHMKYIEQQDRLISKTPESLAKSSAELAKFNQYLTTINPKGLKEFASQIEIIRSLLGDGTTGSIKKATTEIQKLKASMKDAGYEGGNLFTFIGQKLKTFTTYLISSKLSSAFFGTLSSAKDNVLALDEAMTNLRIVTGKTRTETEALLKAYNDMAKTLGTTTAEVAAGATDWLRQGYNTADSAELLKQSMTLSIVGGMESEEATNALTAALKGYQLQVEDTAGVVDKFFTVDMKAATSSSDLATALAKTAANAKLAGLSLDDVIGQLAVVNETMKETGEETGTFYNTMLSRMGAIKSGRLEDPESGESLSDVETTLNGLGVALRDTNGQFRNFGEVLNEVGNDWDQYSNTQQRAIATAFAGTRQQTRFLSLMEGYKQAAKYATDAANSTGVAAEKMAIYQESLEAKAARMSAAFEAFSTAWMPTEVVGFVYDAGAAIADFFAKADGIPATITLITAGIIAAKNAIVLLINTKLGAMIANTGKDLGWPETTGDIIVPIHIKKAA